MICCILDRSTAPYIQDSMLFQSSLCKDKLLQILGNQIAYFGITSLSGIQRLLAE